MAYVSYSQVRNSLASYMDQVCDDRAPLFVTRQNARGVVLISEDDYEGLMETVHLLKSPANATRLDRSHSRPIVVWTSLVLAIGSVGIGWLQKHSLN